MNTKIDSSSLLKFFVKKFKLIKDRNKIKKLPLHEPQFSKLDEKYLLNCLRSTFVSASGSYIDEFVNKLKKITKSKYVLPIINGTSALHLALIAAGVKKNTEVLMPSLNFIASPNATLYLDAVPHFVESEEETLGIDPIKLEKYLKQNTIVKNNICKNKKTKRIISAIIVVHIFGLASKIDEIKKIAKKYKIKLIEDASEALGSTYKKKSLGTFGDIGTISFNGNKIITTGGGGAILTNSNKFFKNISKIYNTGKKLHKWNLEYERKAYNYRLPNLNAALGCAQISNFLKKIKRKRLIFKNYQKIFKKYNFLVELKKESKNSKSNYWLSTILLKKPDIKLRNNILKKLNNIDVFVRPVWKLNHKLSYLSKFPKMNLSTSINLEKRIINLPSSSHLKI